MADQVGLGSAVAGFGRAQGAHSGGAAAVAEAEQGRAKATLARDEKAEAAPPRSQDRVADRAAMPDGPLEGSGDSGGGSGFGQGALDGACEEMIKLQKELEGLGSGPEAMTKSMALQFKMQNIQQVISAVTKIREMAHESIMRTFSR